MPDLRQIHTFAGFEVDTARFEVRRAGLPLSLTRKEFDLLVLLAEQAPAAVTKDEILGRVWAGTVVEEGTLTKTVSRLRSSLGPAGASLIATVTGVGYRLEASVERRVPAPPAGVAPPVAAAERRAPWTGAVVVAVVILAMVAWAWWLLRPAPRVPATTLSLSGWFADVAIAPAGPLVAVVRRVSPVGPGVVEVFANDAGAPAWRDTGGTGASGLAWSGEAARLGYARDDAALGRVWITVTSPGPSAVVDTRPLPPALAAATSFAWRGDQAIIAGGVPGGGLIEWSLADGTLRPLTRPADGVVDTMPAVAPDGRRIAFVRVGATGEGEVYVVAGDGGAERSLTDDDGVVSGVTWARDGGSILFGSTRAGRASGGLWRVAVTGGPVEAVAPDVARGASPVQQRDHLAYVERYRDANLYLRQGAGDWSPLFESPDDEHSPTMSPDGARLAFISSRTGHEEVWVGAIDAAAPRAITAIGGAGVGSPRWSPDGRWIAFDATSAGDGNVYVIPADGGAPRQVTRTTSHDVIPAWSPDGRWLYFRSHRDAAARLYRVPVTSAGPAPDVEPELVADEEIWEAQPGASALAFVRRLEARGLFVRPADRGPSRLLTGTDDVLAWRAWTVAGETAYLVSESAPGISTLLAVSLTGRDAPRVLWQGGWSRLRAYPSLAVSADGTRMVLARADERVRIHRR